MGRTLPSATQLFLEAEGAAAEFFKGLSPRDRRILDDLFDLAHRHIAEVAYAAHPLPLEMFILAMLLEQHKEVMRLKAQVEKLIGHPIEQRPRDPLQLF